MTLDERVLQYCKEKNTEIKDLNGNFCPDFANWLNNKLNLLEPKSNPEITMKWEK